MDASTSAHRLLHQVRKSHVCHFYSTRQDLVDVLVPFFKEGLENGEFCLWGCDEPLTTDDAIAELQKAVPDIEGYLDRGQLQIFPAAELYRGQFDEVFSFHQFMSAVQGAISRGFDGFRCNGNTANVPSRDFLNFMLYEEKVTSALPAFKITAMCSYPLAKCSESEVRLARRHHQATLRKRGDQWEFVPGSEPTA